MKMIYPKYDPGTYHTRELYRQVCESKDLRVVWAYVNARKWNVDYDEFLELCKPECVNCGHELDYGLGKNNEDKTSEATPSTDHMIPQSKGGVDSIGNFWIICMQCNKLKNDATHEDIRRYEGIIKKLNETKTEQNNET
jgi:5-methylcytosine-specific restriction endonuclease McrA